MNLVFWQESVSPHQAALLQSLTRRCPVTLVAAFLLTKRRINLGWVAPKYDGVRVIIAPTRHEIEDLLSTAPEATTHVMSGIDSYPLIHFARRMGLTNHIRLGIYSEARDWHGWKGALRLINGKVDAWRYADKIQFALCVGDLGIRWFQKCGFRDDYLFPFGYFTDRRALPATFTKNGEFRFTFVGQLHRRKGLDLLFTALSRLQRRRWTIVVIGDGPERESLERLALGLGLASRVEFRGVQGVEKIHEALQTTDCLVLPSRWDGWGMVVSEAYANGTRVICSDCCGAAVLVSASGHGSVFSSSRGSVDALTESLSRVLEEGPLTWEHRLTINQWAGRINGDSAANYLLAVTHHVEGEKPSPPWESAPV